MYGASRFLTNNLITSSSMITMSTMSPGWVSGTRKVGTGSALVSVTGQFTGTVNTLFFWQIDDVSAGNEIAQATARWKTDQTASGWEATGVATSTIDALLEDAVYIKSIAGTGNDFEDGDYWEFRAIAQYAPGKVLDLKRNTYAKSNAVTTLNFVVNLGSAKLVTAALLYDHNLTDSATVTLEGNASDSWGAPSYSQALTVAELTPIIEYLSETYQYFRVVISDSTNTDGFIRVGGLYLGTYTELDSFNGDWGSTEDFSEIGTEQRNAAGVVAASMYAEQRTVTLPLGLLSNTDYDSLKAIMQAVRIPSTRESLPFYFHLFYDVAGSLRLGRFQGALPRSFSFPLYNTSSLNIEEVVKVDFS